MILRYPTSYYDSVLPRLPADHGNVTFTCSQPNPPRSDLAFSQLPSADGGTAAPRLFGATPGQSGALVYTVTGSAAGVTGGGTKQYEPGQVIDFEQAPAPSVELMVQPQFAQVYSEIRHDTNVIDLSALGLDDTQIAAVTADSSTALASLTATINDYRAEQLSIGVRLQDNQQALNEAAKAVAAITSALKSVPSAALVAIQQQLQATSTDLTAQRGVLITQANDLAALIAQAQDDLVAVAQLVR